MYNVSNNYRYLVQKIVDKDTISVALANIDENIVNDSVANEAYQYLLNNTLTNDIVNEKYPLIQPYVTMQPGARGQWDYILKKNGTSSDIKLNSVSITDLYMASLSVGNVPCSIANFDVRTCELSKDDKLELILTFQGEEIPIGIYYVQDDISSVESSMTFTAKDIINTAENKAYVTTLDYTNGQTIKSVYDEICALCMIESEDIVFPNIMIKSKITKDNCREALGVIGSLLGKNIVANRYGKLEAKWFNDTVVTYDAGRHYRYNAATDTSGSNIVMCTVGNGTLISGNDGYIMKMSSDYMTQEQLDSIKNSVDMTYTGGYMKCIGDPSLDVGDIIYAQTIAGIKGNLPIMSRTFTFNGGCFDEFTSYPNTLRVVDSTDKKTIQQVLQDIIEKQTQSTENLESFSSLIQESLDDLQSQIDGNITTWFYDYKPTLDNPPVITWTSVDERIAHLGDLFYDTRTGYCYRFQVNNGSYDWGRITDTDIATALENASKAQDTADNKRRVFTTIPTVPYDIGDLWTTGQFGDILVCITSKAANEKFSNSDWGKASKYTDDTTADRAQELAKSADQTLAQWCHDNDRTLIDGGKVYCDSLSAINANLGTIIAGILQSENFESNGEEILNSDGTININYEVLKGIILSLNDMMLKTPHSELGDNHFYEDGTILNGTMDSNEGVGIRVMMNGENNKNTGYACFTNGSNNVVGKPLGYASVYEETNNPTGSITLSNDNVLTVRATNHFYKNIGNAIFAHVTVIANVYDDVGTIGECECDLELTRSNRNADEYYKYKQFDASTDGKTFTTQLDDDAKVILSTASEMSLIMQKFDVTVDNMREILKGNRVTLSRGPRHANVVLKENSQHFSIGKASVIGTKNATVLGNGLISELDSQTVIGTYNKPSNALFVIGNGTSDEDRNNLLEVYDSGSYHLNSVCSVGYYFTRDDYATGVEDISATDSRFQSYYETTGDEVELNIFAHLQDGNFGINTKLIGTLPEPYRPHTIKTGAAVIGSSQWNSSYIGEYFIYTTGAIYITCSKGDANATCVKFSTSYKF